MEMRVLLALPPDSHECEIYKVTGIRAPPLGLGYVASVLESLGHKVTIIDSPTLRISTKEFMVKVKEFKPDIIGLSIQTPLAPKAYRTAKLLKEELNDIVIIAGGIHPTFLYKEALSNGIDIVVRGEGEETIRELVEVIEKYGSSEEVLKKVRGIAFKNKEGKVITTQLRNYILDLDKVPSPARHLLPMDKYTLFNKSIRVAHVMASRGCPYGCIFCSTSYFWGRRIRFRSALNVVNEVEEIVDKYKAKYIVFTDDELVSNRRFTHEFIREIRERGLDIVFTAGARVDHVNKDYLKFLYDNGCVALYFGVESASQETLNKVGKGITIDQVRRVFRWVKELRGFATGSFMLGFPWERVEDLESTIKFAIELDPSYAQFTIVTPYPGTPLYNFAKENNLIVDTDWEHYTTLKPVMRGFHLDPQTIYRYLKKAYYKFYLRLGFLWRELKEGRFHELIRILLKELGSYVFEKLLIR